MMDLFPTGMSFVWRADNDGQPFHVTPNDIGGSTAWGVTFTTWAGWQRLHAAPVSMEAFQACTQSNFLPLYRALYWNSCRCGNMGAIGIQIFDAAMGSGPGNAGLFLQHVLKAVGSPYAGNSEIGPVMIAALNNSVPAAINFALCNERERFYASLPTARYFERGWDRRAEDCRDLVASLINAPASLGTPPKPLVSASQTFVEVPIGGGSVQASNLTADQLDALYNKPEQS